MATLTLARGGQVIWTHRLDRHCSRIGRDPHMDIVLADPEVSRLHTVLYEVEGGHRMIDNSTNGTLVNGERREVCRLLDGDRITVGPYEIGYQGQGAEQPLPATIPAGSRPRVVGYRARSGRLLTVQDVLIVRDAGQTPFAWTLSERATIGSDDSADLVVGASQPVACTLSREPRGYRLTAHSGEILIDGRPTRQALLRRGNTFEIGEAQIQLAVEDGEEEIPTSPHTEYEGMVGSTEAMAKMFALIERIAPLKDPVIILGETGTGKELVARALHSRSGRRDEPFIAVNCGAISRELAESQLFGHVRGAFTGSVGDRDGAFQHADGGTLFLDEIGELPLDLQVKLLRALETGQVNRVGEATPRHVDVRIICATHRDLRAEVQSGTFRQDVFFRLFVIPIHVPPLRERAEDIPLLVDHFLRGLGAQREITPPAQRKLALHRWPGNVRELRHVLTRALACAPAGPLSATDIQLIDEPSLAQDEPTPMPALVSLEEMERELIARTLASCESRRDAARQLGIARSTLHVKMKKYDLS